MTQIILIILGIAVVVLLLVKRTRQGIVGICTVAMEQTVRKNTNKDKILELLGERGELSNSDIREALGVSSSSAARYMDELEREGKVAQIGSTGQAVSYRLK